MTEANVLVAGGRGFTDYDLLGEKMNAFLSRLIREKKKIIIISGGARGADQLGERYAKNHGFTIRRFTPDWSTGRGAGFARNSDMIAVADYVVCFWDGESRGTLDTIKKARAAELPLRIVRY